jgi:site-specific DNA recombinase
VLTNPTYVGQVFANRVRTRPAGRRRSALQPVGRGGMGATQAVDAAEWIAVAPVPAIVSQAQFDRAQERLAYNRQMARRNNRVHPYLLRGLVSCGQCRLACCDRCTRAGYAYYVCPTRLRSRLLVPGERCPARYIPACALDDLVWRDLCEVLAAPEMIAHAMARARGGHWLPQELQARRANLRRGRAALGQQIERLTDAYLAGVVPMAEYQRRRRNTEARLQALDRQETELTHDAERQGETAGLAAHAEAFCRLVRDGLAGAGFDQKQALLELLVDRLVVADGAIEIRYVVPTGPDGEREPFCRLRSDYRDSNGAIQTPGRPQTTRPEPACATGRGRHRRRSAEHDDPKGKAHLRPGRLDAAREGAAQLCAGPCNNAHPHP